MKQQKLQVYVSCADTAMQLEVQAAVDAILQVGHMPTGMGFFSSIDPKRNIAERLIYESDFFLLILGDSYGPMDKKTGKSYAHLEYEYAMYCGKPALSLVISSKSLSGKIGSFAHTAVQNRCHEKWIEFRETVFKKLVRFWDDAQDIKTAVNETLAEFNLTVSGESFKKNPDYNHTHHRYNDLDLLYQENTQLKNELLDLRNNSNNIYAGLSYNELERYLKNQKFQIDQSEHSLFDLFITNIDSLTKEGGLQLYGFNLAKYKIQFDKLIIFKLVKFNAEYPLSRISASYSITDIGYDFYTSIMVRSGIQMEMNKQ